MKRKQPRVADSEHDTPTSPSGFRLFVVSLALAALTAITLWPALACDFVNLDDPVYVTEEPQVQQGLTWSGLGWAFSNFSAGFWQPLTWISYQIDSQIFGLNPHGFHATNLALHLASVVILFLVLARATGAVWPSAMAAALFGIHPLHVESVVWIAERKDVLSTFFWMLTLWAYVKHAREALPSHRFRPSRFYFLALFFFVCGLLSKTMLVTVPLVMLLLDYWPLNRWRAPSASGRGDQNADRRGAAAALFREKIPFFAAAFVCGVLTVVAEKRIDALRSAHEFPFPARTANAVLSTARYLAQTVWPRDLAIFYPYPKTFSFVAVAAISVMLALAVVIAERQAKRRPWIAVGLLWYLVTLAPVIGLIQVGGHAHADRYTYVPLIGIFIVIAWGLQVVSRRSPLFGVVAAAVSLVMVAACMSVTRHQLAFWRNGEILFRHAIAVTGPNPLAHNNLGTALVGKGRHDEAIAEYREAIRLDPADPMALNNLGLELAHAGRFPEAIDCYRQSLQRETNYVGTYVNLGAALSDSGRLDEAIALFRQALSMQPNNPLALQNLGLALGRNGDVDAAIPCFRQALALQPGYIDAEYNLGVALTQKERWPEAIACYQAVLAVHPENTFARNNLGDALLHAGRVDDAIAQFEEVLRQQPDDANAAANLQRALSRKREGK
jgi:Flp pilus assembly protein TadD